MSYSIYFRVYLVLFTYNIHAVNSTNYNLYKLHVCICAKLLQSCLTLCYPMDYSLPGSSVHGIFQVRILEWVAITYSRRIFLTQGSNLHLLCLLHCRRVLHLVSHQRSLVFNAIRRKQECPGLLLLLLSHFSRVRLCETP